jgi:hypothetical protein
VTQKASLACHLLPLPGSAARRIATDLPHPAATSQCFIRRTFTCLQRRLLPLFPREFGDYMLAGGWLGRLVVSAMQSFLCVWVKRAVFVTGISRPSLPFSQPPWRPAPPHGFTLRCAAPLTCRSWARV